MSPEAPDESTIHERVMSRLRDTFAGCDPEATFELLSYWMLRAAEKKALITKKEVAARVQAVGAFVQNRAAYHREAESIIPLVDEQPGDPERLFAEFYRGVAARFQHIQADVDVPREHWLGDIKRAYEETRCVVLRGASGQGKSALAYRYLKQYVPSAWRYEVRLIDGPQHAIGLARALFGHINAIGAPAFVYVDVPPGGNAWVELIRELASLENVHFLVSIREEDWRRTHADTLLVELRELELRLTREEAAQIYSRLSEQGNPGHLLGFDDAWVRFGQRGPLLEFSHFIVHNELLERRLRGQIDRIRDEVRRGERPFENLALLRQASRSCIRCSTCGRLVARGLRRHRPGTVAQPA